MPPVMESNDFTMRRKEFPALPRNLSTADSSSSESSWSDESSEETSSWQTDTPKDNDTSTTREVNISADDQVSNIPSSVINDHYGILGLLRFIRAAEAKPDLGLLTVGENLSALNLNLKSSDNLYSTFEGPWTGVVDQKNTYIPYKLTPSVQKRLANVFISKYDDDLLFYVFYSSPRDVLQLVAAAELYKRGWRYHKKQRVWMCSLPGGAKLEESAKFILNTYYVFDFKCWKKVIKECFLDCGQIEGPPVVPEFLRLLS